MAAPAYLYSEVMQDVLRKMPRMGKMFSADAAGIGTNYIVNLLNFNHSTYANDLFRGQSIYRYGVATSTPADRVRTAYDLGVPADGKLYHDGANYTDVTTLPLALLNVDPDRYKGWVMEAQRRQYRLTNRALVRPGLDLNMERSDTNYWDATSGGSKSGCNVAKTTSDVLVGTRTLTITATGASWYVIGSSVSVDPGYPVLMPVIVRAAVGSITVQPYDVTNSAVFGTAITYSGLDWALVIPPKVQTPSGCEAVAWKFSGTSASDQVRVNTCFGPYDGRLQYILPTEIDEGFKLQFVRTCSYARQLATGVFSAQTRMWEGDFTETGGDYAVEIFRQDNVYQNLAFDKSVQDEIQSLQWPLWLAGGPQVSDTEPLSDEAAGTTTQPLDEVSNYVLWVAMEDLSGGDKTHPEFGADYALFESKCAMQTLTRPRQKKQPGSSRTRIGVW